MDANNYKAFTGKGRRRRHTQMSEINVTPFVDVMLVLLIVFMVTAPLLTVGVPLELPSSKAATVQGNDEPLVISVDGEGRLYLEDVEIELANLVPKLLAVTGAKQDQRIFVRGDTNVAYGRVLSVMGEIHNAGFKRVAMVSAGPGKAASDAQQDSNE
ncbi:protein TolR [Sneathiella sp. HT1-7]|jgi:biopolymer transport protein TolR|uniref:protein TolR n=1 Tax=Sneathiella sp. HT1-7 TaxID=2887192 RepID=UPI001D14FE66|nr:protein TolR [Sneathiella sp. HT1-7]MCC3305429.1 protein TolR [Sneathiella sp. HT1-7]